MFFGGGGLFVGSSPGCFQNLGRFQCSFRALLHTCVLRSAAFGNFRFHFLSGASATPPEGVATPSCPRLVWGFLMTCSRGAASYTTLPPPPKKVRPRKTPFVGTGKGGHYKRGLFTRGSLNSLESLQNGRILLCFPQSGDPLESLEISKFSRKWNFSEKTPFPKDPLFSEPEFQAT